MGDAVYFDLDGNGTIDACDQPPPGGGARRPHIVFEGRFVEVEDRKNAFDGRSKSGYVFEDGQWRMI